MEKRQSPDSVTLIALLISLLICMLALTSAYGQSVTELPEVEVERIAVMPFLKGSYGSKIIETINAPLSRLWVNPEKVEHDAIRILTDLVQEELQDRYSTKVVPLSRVMEVHEKLTVDRTKETPRDLSQMLGKALGANLIMAGHVWRYRERVGGSYGVEQPASVAFAVYLIDVLDGKILWKENFKETQRSLSENILNAGKFFKRGAKWLTARDLALYGMKEIFQKYPF